MRSANWKTTTITRILKYIIFIIFGFILLLLLIPTGTSPIVGSNSIAELREIHLGGFPQTVLLRGNNKDNPFLLYVHGGPGGGQLPLAPQYSQDLEKYFVVVHWDQRGAGASCRNVEWETLSLERIVQDTLELAQILGDGKKIFILGHSWGSLVAAHSVQRRPELFYAYVGTGQLVHRNRQELLSYNWVTAQAKKANDSEALEELAGIHPPYTSQREFSLQRRWLEKYHGDTYAVESERKFRWAKYFGREYSLITRIQYIYCFKKSLEKLLPDRLNVDLLSSAPELRVPVFFFTGRHDYNTTFALVEEWAEVLKAPKVEIVWFENAGHSVAVEAPEEFQRRLIEKLLPIYQESKKQEP